MANFFIYTGLVILLTGAVFGIYVGIQGIRSRKNHSGKFSLLAAWQFGPVSPEMKRLIKIWRILMLIGGIITGIGIAIS